MISASSAQVLIVGSGWFPKSPGGMERYVYELAHQLMAGGEQIELCGVGLPEAIDSALQLTNLADPDQSLPKRLWDCRTTFRQRQRLQLDAINLHFSLYSLPLLTDLPRDVPVTFSFHGPWALESQQEGQKPWSVAFKQWIEHTVYQRCDRFIVLSKAFGTILHQTYQIPWDKIHIIPGGVDVQRFQPNLTRRQAREILGWSLDRPILFTPRRLVQRMGLDVLLQALAVVKLQVPEVWLAIAGKGALRDTLEQQVQAIGLSQQVHFLGYLPDDRLPIAYQAADLTVMPSQSLEGFGLVLVESLACGTPVLCTPVGGMPEIVVPFDPNLMTTDSSIAAIAERLEAILTGSLILPSRDACRNYATTHFDWGILAPKVQKVLVSPK
jgi:glycosyltransferase involved in cell wall biosynthesis